MRFPLFGAVLGHLALKLPKSKEKNSRKKNVFSKIRSVDKKVEFYASLISN
jgi:hypothetical protein